MKFIRIRKLFDQHLADRLDKTISPLDSFIMRIFCSVGKYLSLRIKDHYVADYRSHNLWSQNLELSTGNLGYGLLHYTLIRNLRPATVLYIGSTYGFIPCMYALACKHNRSGHVDFVDTGYDMNNSQDAQKHSFGQASGKSCQRCRINWNFPIIIQE